MIFQKNDIELAGCLRRLFKSRFILRSQNLNWFRTIIDQRESIQNILDKFLLHLEINESLGIIQIRPMNDEAEEAIAFQMGRKRQLSPFASMMLLFLRQERILYFMNPQSDSFPKTETKTMRDFIETFHPFKIDSQFERHFRRALDELETLQVILKTKLNDDLFEISPVCELILPADEITAYQKRIEEYFKTNNQTANDQATNDQTVSVQIEESET
ncbi:MAG: DUF4194 domain-containing protein [Pseudobdellovibrionaceae bacterium]